LEMLKEISDSGDVATRGVSVTKLFGTVDAIISKFNFRASGVKGGHNQTTINDFYGASQTHSRTRPFMYAICRFIGVW